MDETFQTFQLIAKDGEATPPAEIQVIPAGETKTSKGRFVLDGQAASAVVQAFASKRNDLVIDYEHQTLSGKEAPAAGWMKRLVDKGSEGVWAVVEWTERAKQYLAAKEYKYLSPVIQVRKSDGRVMALQHAGLTNTPAIDGMVPLVLKDGLTIRENEETSMKTLFKLLGLKEDATEDQAVEAVKQLQGAAQVVANKKVLETLGLKETATESEVTGTIVALKQTHEQHGSLAQKVEKLTQDLAARDASDLVALAMKDGKVTPAQEPWAKEYATRDPEGFKVFVAKAPIVINTGDVAGSQKPAGGEGGVDETQMLINKQLGVDAETFKKYNSAA